MTKPRPKNSKRANKSKPTELTRAKAQLEWAREVYEKYLGKREIDAQGRVVREVMGAKYRLTRLAGRRVGELQVRIMDQFGPSILSCVLGFMQWADDPANAAALIINGGDRFVAGRGMRHLEDLKELLFPGALERLDGRDWNVVLYAHSKNVPEMDRPAVVGHEEVTAKGKTGPDRARDHRVRDGVAIGFDNYYAGSDYSKTNALLWFVLAENVGGFITAALSSLAGRPKNAPAG